MRKFQWSFAIYSTTTPQTFKLQNYESSVDFNLSAYLNIIFKRVRVKSRLPKKDFFPRSQKLWSDQIRSTINFKNYVHLDFKDEKQPASVAQRIKWLDLFAHSSPNEISVKTCWTRPKIQNKTWRSSAIKNGLCRSKHFRTLIFCLRPRR